MNRIERKSALILFCFFSYPKVFDMLFDEQQGMKKVLLEVEKDRKR